MLVAEQMFYEVMWKARYTPFPMPWWVQQYFKQWYDDYDTGLFVSKESAFASNAHFRYWNMIGVKDHYQESIIGQAGEIEPVYDSYSLSFFLFDKQTKTFYFPQTCQPDEIKQYYESDFLPIINTVYSPSVGFKVTQQVLATTIGADQQSIVISKLKVEKNQPIAGDFLFCVSISPYGPSCFHRQDKAKRFQPTKGLSFLKYNPEENWISKINNNWGPLFSLKPDMFGMYGNDSSFDAGHYILHSPFNDLSHHGTLNNVSKTSDDIAGMCFGVLGWEITPANGLLELNIILPVDDYRGSEDFDMLKKSFTNSNISTLENNNLQYWTKKLSSGLQFNLPNKISHLWDLYRICRSNLLILSDNGEIHPGPTIYNSFWVRDSSVEGIACALAGDSNLSIRQFGYHYTRIFNVDRDEHIGPVSAYGFFGGIHEKADQEWDSNGQALWAICKLDKILGKSENFGESLFSPFILEGARWIRDNRSEFGLLKSGWSAEHIGEKDKPHYWDDFWGLAGLWEAAQMAKKYGKNEASEIWAIYNNLLEATIKSINYVLEEQKKQGHWKTFIPTGPGDIGRLDSTIIGAVAYFHPCKLYDGQKLGNHIDWAARKTLETIWNSFMDGGFRHDSAWQCYGPYLTLQLAHSFLFIGDLKKMDECIKWSVWAGSQEVEGLFGNIWKAALGAWNEQHCYPIAKEFKEHNFKKWYMGDIPHGWACAEFMLLLRDIAFFEVAEDTDPHIYLAPGVLPEWIDDNESISVSEAPTTFGANISFTLTHNKPEKKLTFRITKSPADIKYIYPCRFGNSVKSVTADGQLMPQNSLDIKIPANSENIIIMYQ